MNNEVGRTAVPNLLLLSIGSAQALTSPQQTEFIFNSAPLDYTNWSVTAWLPQFDSRLGSLDTVTITLASRLEGSVKAESRNRVARDVTLKL